MTRPQAWAVLALIFGGIALVVALWLTHGATVGLTAACVWAAAIVLVGAVVWG